MRRYGVNNIFGPTIQGEGSLAGVVCLFVRFSGCNMWDGRPETRAASLCPYCDTDFFAHTMETKESIVACLEALRSPGAEWIWMSGGEPILQVDSPLVDALHGARFKLAIETNGTRPFRPGVAERVDHITVSPKLPFEQTVIRKADTLKVLWPHPNPLIRPHRFDGVEATTRFVQPIECDGDPAQSRANLESAMELLYTLPGWRLGVQLHKLIGVE